MSDRIFRVPPIIHVGEGAAVRAGEEAKAMGAAKALVITDSFLAKSGTIKPVLDSLAAAGLKVAIYDQVNAEPTLAHVTECLALCKDSGSDVIVGCGGGSPIDVAKAVSAMAVNAGKIQDYMGIGKIPKKGLPIIAVPTTAGTGSEATCTTIIADTERDVKMLIISPYLLPSAAVVDPLLTMGMPKGITAATGMDALTHAMEAYVSRKNQPMADVYALSAVKLIYENLPVAWAEPSNLAARTKVLLGALQAGIAFSNASVALVHGMSRPVGALFHVAHGVSNAALLGVVTKFSLSGNYERYADIAIAMGVPNTGTKEAIAMAGAVKVEELIKGLEIPSLTKLGVTREKLDPLVAKMADDAIASGSPANNPRIATKEEIVKLYYEAL
ncbi:Alcohol dehydrogenase 2 [uncultured delta proteobacterium]|uniref:Alcohol dehydrogenase 2 n=1 Tax=uncultured delta proteobacterium TaxID=34034 RepID=A0A212JJR8_9DELT|nr:Alcohol dehydrogenase 2 [uncultured delta proteobacterium]